MTAVTNALNMGCGLVLKGEVLITIVYKTIKPDPHGKLIPAIDQLLLYEQAQKPLHFTYLSEEKGKVYLHESTHYCLDGVEKCINLRLRQNDINFHLHESHSYFEEEIYTFITHLNFNPSNVRSLLRFSLAEATRMIPVNVRMSVSDYDVFPLSQYGKEGIHPEFFGPEDGGEPMITIRELEGKISKARVRHKILSLKDGERFKIHKDTYLHQWILSSTTPYVVYLCLKNNAYVRLAYNPLENPIIYDEDIVRTMEAMADL